MLDKRFKNNGKSSIRLNNLQIKYKKIVEEKLNKEYQLEENNCLICDSNNFEEISEKDRYGLTVQVVICKKCGLIQLNPRMNQESYNTFYDNEYRPLYSGNDQPSITFFKEQKGRGKKIIQHIEEKAGIEIKNMFILEIGSGAGGILSAFKEKENRVLGIDIGNEYIKFGKQKGINLKVGSLKELKLKEKPDIVIYAHVIEHLLNPIEEFKTLKKILKPEGLLYIEVPGIKNLLNSYHLDFLKYIQNAHIYYFTLNSLNNCMKKAGFKLISGDEEIKAIFKIGEIENYKEDYDSTISFLRDLEKKRLSRSFKFKNRVISSIDYLTTTTRTYKIIKNFYGKVKDN